MTIIFVVMLLIIITVLAYANYNLKNDKELRNHVEKKSLEVDAWEDARVKYFYACARKYLKKKYPQMISFEISSGYFKANVHSSTIGFIVHMEDGSIHRCLQDTKEIFYREIIQDEEVEEFVKNAEYEYLKQYVQAIMNEVELAKIDQKPGVDYDISGLEPDQVSRLRDLLLDEGVQTIIDEDNSSILKAVVINDEVA